MVIQPCWRLGCCCRCMPNLSCFVAGVKPPPPPPAKRPQLDLSLPQSTALGTVPAATTTGVKLSQPHLSSQLQPQHIALRVHSSALDDPLIRSAGSGSGLRSISTAGEQKESSHSGEPSREQERDLLLQHQQSSSQRTSDDAGEVHAAGGNGTTDAPAPFAAPASSMRDTAASTIDVRRPATIHMYSVVDLATSFFSSTMIRQCLHLLVCACEMIQWPCVACQTGSMTPCDVLTLQLDDDSWIQDEPANGGGERDRRWRRRCCVMLPAVLVAAALAAAFELRLLHTKQVSPCVRVYVCLQLAALLQMQPVRQGMLTACHSLQPHVLCTYLLTGGHLAWHCSDKLQLGFGCMITTVRCVNDLQTLFYLPAWRWCLFAAGIGPLWYATAGVMRGVVLLVESRWLDTYQAAYYLVSIRVRTFPCGTISIPGVTRFSS